MDTEKLCKLRKYLRMLEREMLFRFKCDSPCCGVTVAQCHVLLGMDDTGETSISVLAESLGVDSSSLSRTVDGLVENGHVSRKDNAKDRRYSNIALTGSGKKIVAKINETFDTAFSPVFENIPLSEHGHMLSFLETITVILKKTRNHKCCEED